MSDQPTSARRSFLQKLTALVGGSVAVAVSAKTVQARPVETDNVPEVVPPESKGYQHTDHVETFYKSNDF